MKKGYLLLLIPLLASCAQIVTPTGGAKDVNPPVVLKELPEGKSVNFGAKTIRITFDEYVVLSNPNDNIFFSPPLKHNPTYLLKGKVLHIKLNDTLQPGKTYNMAFSNAVKDYREGNLLPFYLYSFSTGSHLDTFQINGGLRDARTLDPLDNVLVLLYDRDVDSLPITTEPSYISKSQKDGSFAFQHIAEGNYKIIALKDINNNMLYDLPTEGIAFREAMVPARPMETAPLDTAGGILSPPEERLEDDAGEPPLILFLFTQEDTAQHPLKVNAPRKDVYEIPYKRSFQKHRIRPLQTGYPAYVERVGESNDTLFWYFKQPVEDSLKYEVLLDGEYLDTVILTPYKDPAQRRRGKRPETNLLEITYSQAGDLYRPLTLHFSIPLSRQDSVPVTIISTKKSGGDTVLRRYGIAGDDVMSLPLPFDMEEKVPYVVILCDSLFTAVNGATNDSLVIRFNSKSGKDYGNLFMDYQVEGQGMDYIVSLETAKGKRIQQNIIRNSERIDYEHLIPGDYKVRVVEDRNGNGKWDTGNYHRKIQPEKFYFYDKPITIRGYWDLEEEMVIGQ